MVLHMDRRVCPSQLNFSQLMWRQHGDSAPASAARDRWIDPHNNNVRRRLTNGYWLAGPLSAECDWVGEICGGASDLFVEAH